MLFLPFHYGYWDTDAGHEPGDRCRAANELTLTDWDPASKQPIYKTAAAAAERIEASAGRPSPAPTNTGSAPAGADGQVQPTRGGSDALVTETLATTGGAS